MLSSDNKVLMYYGYELIKATLQAKDLSLSHAALQFSVYMVDYIDIKRY